MSYYKDNEAEEQPEDREKDWKALIREVRRVLLRPLFRKVLKKIVLNILRAPAKICVREYFRSFIFRDVPLY